MKRTHWATLSLAVLSIFAALIFLLASDYQVGIYDEGVMLTGAFRVLNGDVPSKDFYANYGPAQFYVLAGLLKLFGCNVLVARIYDAAVAGLIVAFSYILTLRLSSALFAACCALSIAALLLEFQRHVSPIQVSILLSVLIAAQLIRILVGDVRKKKFLPVSIALAIALLFRYDIAIIVGAALVLSIVFVCALKARDAKIASLRTFQSVLATVSVLATAPVLAVLLLAKAGILLPALKDLLVFNGSNYVAMRSLPFPGPGQVWQAPVHGLAVYFPIGAVALALFTMFRSRSDMRLWHKDKQMVSIIVFTFFAGCFFSKGWVRVSGEHMLFANVPAEILVFLCLHHLFSPDRWWSGTLLTVSLLFFGLALYLNWQSGPLYRHFPYLETDPDMPALSVFRVRPSRMEAARYIARNTKERDRIHSATGRHDKIFVNDALIYFLVRRMPATRWHHYDPGVQTTRVVQQEIIDDLEKNAVFLIMRDFSWDNMGEPNRSSESSGVRDLDRYLDMNYRPVTSADSIIIFSHI